jgi:hypothetical protein
MADDIMEKNAASTVKADLERGVIGNGYVRKAQPHPRNASASQKID